MHQETTDEFARRQGGITAVFCIESHVSVIHGNEALVGDSHAMGVPAEIVKNRFRAAERPLGVNDPILSVELVFQIREAVALF